MSRGVSLGGAVALFALAAGVVTANAAQREWQASPTPLTTLLMQYDAPVDFAATGTPRKCLQTSNATYLVLDERRVLFERQGQIFVNDLARRCPGLRREREDGVPGIGAASAMICSGDQMRLNYDRGSGLALCQLGNFVPVEVIGPADTSAASKDRR